MPESLAQRPDFSTARGVAGWRSRLPGQSGQVMDIYAFANMP